jgi:hypothetical protein
LSVRSRRGPRWRAIRIERRNAGRNARRHTGRNAVEMNRRRRIVLVIRINSSREKTRAFAPAASP